MQMDGSNVTSDSAGWLESLKMLFAFLRRRVKTMSWTAGSYVPEELDPADLLHTALRGCPCW